MILAGGRANIASPCVPAVAFARAPRQRLTFSSPLPLALNAPPRRPLPDHLPRHEVVHQPEANGACVCPACGTGMAQPSEDITEVLD